MRRLFVLLIALAPTCAAFAQDTDGDGLSDALEARLGTDPKRPERLELILDDKAKEEGDKSVGKALKDAYDFTRVYLGNVGRDRWAWRVDFARPFVNNPSVAFIVYIDADNDSSTGRKDGSVGTDVMIRPEHIQVFGSGAGALPRQVCVAEGNSLYFATDMRLKQENGGSVFRMNLLSQNRDVRADSDSSPVVTVRCVGNSDKDPPPVPPDHPLYLAPMGISYAGVKVFHDPLRAHVTWITSRPTYSLMEWGETADYGKEESFRQTPVRNHRLILHELRPNTRYHVRISTPDEGKGPVRSPDLAVDTTPPPTKPCSVPQARIPIVMANPTGLPLTNWPITFGLPFPIGHLASPDKMRVLDPDGEEIPAQAAVTARWKDGSVKWALLDCHITLPPNASKAYDVEYGEQISRTKPPSPLRTEETADGLTVVTGPLKLVVSRNAFDMLGAVWLDGERVTNGGSIALVDDKGKEFATATPPDSVTVEEAGPLRVVLKAQGKHTASDGRALFNYTVRLVAYAGQPFVRVFHTFGNDNINQSFTSIRSLSLRTRLARPASEGAAGGDSPAKLLLSEQPACLFQDLDNHFALSGIAQAVNGKRAQGWVRLGDGLTVALRDFWQNYPKSLTADRQGVEVAICPPLKNDEYTAYKDLEDRLFYYLLNGQYKFKQGVQKTHELLYGFGGGEQAQAWVAALNAPVVPAAPTQWYCDSGAFGEITPRTPGEFDAYEAMVDKCVAAVHQQRESYREYGMLNYGDYYGERKYNWGNIEYDTQHGHLMQFARTGNRQHFLIAEAAARHNADVDHIHYSADPDDVGEVYCHCIGHTGDYYPAGFKPPAIAAGHYNSGHAWNRGNLEYYFLTGYRPALEAATQLADMQARRETVNHRVAGAERATAWPLIAAVAAWRATCDEYYLNAARLYAEAVVNQQGEFGHWNIPAGYSKLKPVPIGGYAWCAGLLLCALEDYYDETGDERAAKAAIKAGEWLARDEWRPERHGFRTASAPDLNDPPAGCEATRVAPALGFVYELTRDKKFLDIALDAFSYDMHGGAGKGSSTALAVSPHFIHDLKRAGLKQLLPLGEPAGVVIPRVLSLLPGEPAELVCRRLGREGEAPVLRVDSLPAGWGAEPKEAKLADVLTFRLTPPTPPAPGAMHEIAIIEQRGKEQRRHRVFISFVAPGRRGDRIGLIAGPEDFLGPALERAGVKFERIADVTKDLSAYRVIWLGTQAHELDAAGVASNPVALHNYVKSGGTLAVSQMNDTQWRADFLPLEVQLSEENGESGKIVAPEHPIFQRPHRITNVAGMMCYDTITRLGPGWTVLLEDGKGQPAIAETKCGDGRILIFEPSVERYLTGELLGVEQAARLFENLVTYVQSGCR